MIDDKTGLDFPLFQNQLTSYFGDPRDRSFPQGYLRTIDLREFGIPTFQRIYCNYVMEGPLKKALAVIAERGLIGEIKTYDGCWNIRVMKGNAGLLSVHSWGMALDLNTATNPFQRDGSEEVITDFSPGFIQCFSAAGFEWGGLWHSCHDAMHFQLPWTTDWRNSIDPLRPISYL